jgi:glycopeptide antibiotics resistance protein
VAYDRYWSRTVVIDVRFYFYLAAILDLILFPFPLTPAQLLRDGLPIRGCAANMTIVLVTHH